MHWLTTSVQPDTPLSGLALLHAVLFHIVTLLHDVLFHIVTLLHDVLYNSVTLHCNFHTTYTLYNIALLADNNALLFVFSFSFVFVYNTHVFVCIGRYVEQLVKWSDAP